MDNCTKYKGLVGTSRKRNNTLHIFEDCPFLYAQNVYLSSLRKI